MSIEAVHRLSFFCGYDLLLPPGREASSAAPWIESAQIAAAGAESVPGGLSSTFSFEDAVYKAVILDERAAETLEGWSRVPVRQLLGTASPEEAAYLLKAQAYAQWAWVARFCSACGGDLREGEVDGELGGRVCRTCGRVFFPRLSPAIITLVSRGDEILLAHNVKFPSGRYSVLAGFVEPGETLEETVVREIREEAGIEIHPPRYVASQPWPFPDSLMLAFEAEYRSGEARPDGIELDTLGWFRVDALPDLPPRGSVSRFLIERFIESRREASEPAFPPSS